LHNQHNLYIAEKYIQWATVLLQTLWVYRYLAIVAFQNREIMRNSDKIWPYSSSRSSILVSTESSYV